MFTFTLVLVLQRMYGMSHFFLIPTLKNLRNRPTFAKVTVKIKVAQFFLTHSVYSITQSEYISDIYDIYVGFFVD